MLRIFLEERVCAWTPLFFLDIPTRWKGHRLGRDAHSPVRALDFYRALDSALPSLLYFHRILVLTNCAVRA